ncbi:MAG: PilZ domain-containing protein [Myxococcota bacterium]
MRKAATVLVLGDPGPIRDELLLRSEIDVVWSVSFRDALELLRVYRVEACILSPEFEQLPGYQPFREVLGQVPCLVQGPVDEPLPAPPGPDELSVWAHEDVEPVLAFLARHTGLVFARYPRAPVRLSVEVGVHGETYALETTNLSVSGVAIDSFPDVEPSTRVELCLDLPERPVYLLARVVRLIENDGRRQAGLSFTDLSENLRAAIASCVDEALPADAPEERLFGELEIPLPRPRPVSGRETTELELVSITSPPEAGPCSEIPGSLMRNIAGPTGLTDNLVPTWFEHLTEDLTNIERAAALGNEAPEWAHRVLRLRIEIARARADDTGSLPPALLDEAYRTCAGLEEETQDAPIVVRQQVSTIRASLLRDVLGEAI